MEYAEVEMRTRRVASGSAYPDLLPGGHFVSRRDVQLAEVTVERDIPVVVVNEHHLTVAHVRVRVVPPRELDGACRGSENGLVANVKIVPVVPVVVDILPKPGRPIRREEIGRLPVRRQSGQTVGDDDLAVNRGVRLGVVHLP